MLGNAEVLPALPEEPEDLVHAARIGQAQADGPIEGILAHPDVVAVAAAFEVDRPDQIDFVKFVGCSGLRAGVLLTWQQRGEPDPRRGQAVALEHALDGARVGKRYRGLYLRLVVDTGRGWLTAYWNGRVLKRWPYKLLND